MALVSSLPPQSKWLQRCDSMPCVNPKGISKHRDKLVFCSKKTVSNEKSRSANFQRCLPTKRRDALVQILLSTVSFPLIMSDASAETAIWWERYGYDCPALQKFAIRVLSLTCSATGCERNWSVFDQIHSKRRNRLELKRLNALVFVKYNLQLEQRQITRRKKDNLDPICLSDLESDDEWITELEDPSLPQSEWTEVNECFTTQDLEATVRQPKKRRDPDENFQIFTDETNKFKISIPQDWAVGAGEPNGFKSVTAFYPKEDTNSNVSVVITGIGPDFTRLESFGKVDEFAETLVSGLDRSWQRPPGLAAKLIDCKAAKGLYYIEYSLQNPGESCRHIFSAIGMASNGWYNRLYTVTGQYMEEESVKYKSNIEKAVSSFKFT